MSGRAILFLVIGFSVLFLITERNISVASNRAVDNMAYYYENMNVHNIAVSGANVAANQFFLDPTWTAGFNNVPFGGGSYTVTVNIINASTNTRQICSVGYYEGFTDTVLVTLKPSGFSKFAYYSVSEGTNPTFWITGDTVWGPLHSQDKLTISGDPVFEGKVTTLTHFVTKGYSNPEFNGGYQSGVDMPMPPNGTANLKSLADNGGADFTGHDTVYVKFAGDSIKYKYSYGSSYTSVLASTFAPNGAIFATGATLRLQGTVAGQYSIGASQITTGSGPHAIKTGGNIYLDDNIVYNTDPRSNPGSTDLLGIVAQNNVIVSDNLANSTDINVDASIYAETGGFGAQDYNTRPLSGTINLYGGVQQNGRIPVGDYVTNGSNLYLVSGFYKNYRYDNRLLTISPPGYPFTGMFEIVSWYE